MVTVMARNGVNFGIRLSGTGDRWFGGSANPVNGLYFPGYTVEDAAADTRRFGDYRDRWARRASASPRTAILHGREKLRA